MNQLSITGKIQKIMDLNQISDTFCKREFILNTGGEYPQEIILQTTQENCDKIDNRKVGDDVEVKFNIKGRAWTPEGGETKWFNSLDVWFIKKLDVNNVNPEDDLPY